MAERWGLEEVQGLVPADASGSPFCFQFEHLKVDRIMNCGMDERDGEVNRGNQQ